MQSIGDSAAEHDLAAAGARGVRVRVVLDQREESENSSAYQYLTSHGVKVVWSWSKYEYTHQKTVVIAEPRPSS
jgi:phosphatidylserine/phosphatidylglycerophosphate/cardiolipin synthase-like enzyme